MGLKKPVSLHVFDAVGGLVVLSCLLGAVWLTVVRVDRSAAEVGDLTSRISAAREDERNLDSTRQRLVALLEERQGALVVTGKLPNEAPVEAYFQELSRMAVAEQLRVVRHDPLAPRAYPGLVEKRYIYEVTGTWHAVIAFLRSIEHSNYWADVSYLKIDRGRGNEELAKTQRSATLTISLFAASKADGASDSEGA